MNVEELDVLKKCQWQAQSSFLANEVASVEELVVLKKWTPALQAAVG